MCGHGEPRHVEARSPVLPVFAFSGRTRSCLSSNSPSASLYSPVYVDHVYGLLASMEIRTRVELFAQTPVSVYVCPYLSASIS